MQWHKNNWPRISHHTVVLFHHVWMILACRARWSEWTFERSVAENGTNWGEINASVHIRLWTETHAEYLEGKTRRSLLDTVMMFDLVHSIAIMHRFCLNKVWSSAVWSNFDQVSVFIVRIEVHQKTQRALYTQQCLMYCLEENRWEKAPSNLSSV